MKFKLAKTAYCAYLHSDGHAVIIHQERHPKAGSIQWAEIIEKIDAKCRFTGRIVFHNPYRDHRFRLCLNGASEIRASLPCHENGSDRTREMGLTICSFTIEFKDGSELYW